MLFRLIGKLYFYFVILPVIGDTITVITKTLVDYSEHKAVDPTWDMKKQRAADAARRNARRSRGRAR
jgi:hypothetical protein